MMLPAIVLSAKRSGNENSPPFQTYTFVIAAGTLSPGKPGDERIGSDRQRGNYMTIEPVRNAGFPRPLTVEEHELIESLLGAVRSGISRYISQLEQSQVVGSCGCGCPSIDLAVTEDSDRSAMPLILGNAESPEGVQVGVILWERGGRLSGLEVHPWDGSDVIRLPRPETLCNLRTGG